MGEGEREGDCMGGWEEGPAFLLWGVIVRGGTRACHTVFAPVLGPLAASCLLISRGTPSPCSPPAKSEVPISRDGREGRGGKGREKKNWVRAPLLLPPLGESEKVSVGWAGLDLDWAKLGRRGPG